MTKCPPNIHLFMYTFLYNLTFISWESRYCLWILWWKQHGSCLLGGNIPLWGTVGKIIIQYNKCYNSCEPGIVGTKFKHIH